MIQLLRSIWRALVRFSAQVRLRIGRFFLAQSRYDTVVWKLGGRIHEMPPRQTWFFRKAPKGLPLMDVLFMGRLLKKDPKVKRLIVHLRPIAAGWSQVQTIARVLQSIRDAGIETVAFLDRGGNREYYLAAQCNRIIAPPTLSINLIGVMVESVFLKELMDKLSIYPDMQSKGKYKSAVETFTRKAPTRPASQMMDSLVDGLYNQLVEGIATGRNVETEEASKWVDTGPHVAEQAIESGMIDKAMYYEDFLKMLSAESPKPKKVKSKRYLKAWSKLERFRALSAERGALALVYADGAILDSGTERNTTKSVTDKLCRDIRKIAKEKQIKAVILRVNSPGGSAYASDLIWRSLCALREKKPVIVSMGDYAASGGYYIAMAGDEVLTEPATLTGSIGVIVGKMSLKGLYKKLGIAKQQYARGDQARLFSDYSRFSDSERGRIKALLEHNYTNFVDKVAQSRDTTVEEIEKVAQGRVFLGSEAVENGLADQVGGLEQAFEIAKAKANLQPDEPIEVILYPRPKTSWRQILESGIKSALPAPLRALNEELTELTTFDQGAQYRLPFIIRMP